MQGVGVDFAGGLEDGDLLGDVFELPDVARPAVGEQRALGFLGELYGRHVVFLGKVGGKFAEQQQDVVAAVAQRRQFDGHRAEPVEEVFPETSFGNGFPHVDVGGGDDAHVGFLHLRRTHLYELAVFEHAQQTGLRGHGQLAHLVEEDGTAVGLLEIALAVGQGTGKRPFFVAEEFRVDRSLGYGTAVHGDITAVFAGAVGVYYLRKGFLTRTAFAGDEDRQVGRGDLQGAAHGAQQARAVADDAEALFRL